jgi:hypothetical protein
MSNEIENFKKIYYPGRFVRHLGNRKVILRAYINSLDEAYIVFVDNTRCTNLKDIELDGRR